jgi:DUF4097 and DUF4098 domain-containing protein YvlB
MRLPALLLLSATALPAQEILGRRDRVFTLTERVNSGDDVRIFARQGTITVIEGSGSTVEFRAEKERGDVDDIGFVVRRGGGLTICAIYDSDDECSDDGVRSEGRRWRNWGDRARANITVTVPRGMRLRIGSGNGDVSVTSAAAEARVASGNGRVRVSGVRGQVTASSGNGRVTVDDVTGPVKASSGNGDVSIGTIAGPVNASSGNGDILVSMDRITGDGDMEFSSGNGRIEVTLPADFSADVEATTGSGRITTDFPIKVQGRLTRSRLRGTIGDGGRRLRMSTGNGSMELRRR